MNRTRRRGQGLRARLAGEETEPRGPIDTEAARRLADGLKNE